MWIETIIHVLLKSSAALNTPVDWAGVILCYYSLLPWDRKQQCIYLFSPEVSSVNKWIKSASLKLSDYKSSHLLYLLQKEKLKKHPPDIWSWISWRWNVICQPIAWLFPSSLNHHAFIWSLWTAERWVLRMHWWTEYSYWGKVKEHKLWAYSSVYGGDIQFRTSHLTLLWFLVSELFLPASQPGTCRAAPRTQSNIRLISNHSEHPDNAYLMNKRIHGGVEVLEQEEGGDDD